jgi:hypothetical protein
MYDNGGLETTFFTDRPFLKFDAQFLQDFTVTADWDFYNYTNKEKTIENRYSFLNASLFYREQDSKWEYQIQATNILNVDFINNDSFNENFNSTSSYMVLPRIVMFIITYNL